MSDAGLALQRAIVAALTGDAALMGQVGGVFDGVPPRATFPYISLGPSIVTDWSHKSGQGREHRVQISVWDDGDGGGHARLRAVMAAVEVALRGIGPLAGHQLVRFGFLRSFVTRDPAGPDQGVIEYRALTLAA